MALQMIAKYADRNLYTFPRNRSIQILEFCKHPNAVSDRKERMKMKKRTRFPVLLLLFTVMTCIFSLPCVAHAAKASAVTLKADKTYKNYDITGDQKKDTIKIKTGKHVSYDWKDKLSVIINGKTCYKFTNQYFEGEPTIRLYTMTNGKKFLYLDAQSTNGDGPVCAVFQYKSGKLKKVIDFHKLFEGYGSHLRGSVQKVKGNTLYTEYYVMSWSTGPSTIKVNYTYKNGTLKRTGNTYQYKENYSYGKKTTTFYANKSLAATTGANSSKKAFTVKKGGKVTVSKCYSNGKKMLIQVKYKGKYGWIKALNGYPGYGNGQFSNVTYAG